MAKPLKSRVRKHVRIERVRAVNKRTFSETCLNVVDWRVYNQNKEQETFYRMIITWFGDTNSDQCPFSVHRLAEIGKSFGKLPGEWYGPSSVAHILR